MMGSPTETFTFDINEYIGPECACDIEGLVRGMEHVVDSAFDPLTTILKVTSHRVMIKREDVLRHLEHCRIQCSEAPPKGEAGHEHAVAGTPMAHAPEHDHHAMMEAEFKRHFIVSLVFTIPVLVMSPTVQGWFGIEVPRFPGYDVILLIFASIVAFYGGWVF